MDSWWFCDNRRGKESEICWQHAEMQFRANEHMLPVRKHCHSLTCILSKPSFCLREMEVQHMVLKFTCAPSQKTPAPQITSIIHYAFARKICPRFTTMQKYSVMHHKEKDNNYNKMLHFVTKTVTFFFLIKRLCQMHHSNWVVCSQYISSSTDRSFCYKPTSFYLEIKSHFPKLTAHPLKHYR